MCQFFRNCDWRASVAGIHLTTSSWIGNEEAFDLELKELQQHRESYVVEGLEGRWRGENLYDWDVEDNFPRNRIEIMRAAQPDLALLKKLESCLRGAVGGKTLHVEFGINLRSTLDLDNTTIDLSGLEVTSFSLDKLVKDIFVGYRSWKIDEFHGHSEGLRSKLEMEVKRLGTVLVNKNISITCATKEAPFLFDDAMDLDLTRVTWQFEVTRV
jgi:hypothetical protein